MPWVKQLSRRNEIRNKFLKLPRREILTVSSIASARRYNQPCGMVTLLDDYLVCPIERPCYCGVIVGQHGRRP